MVDFATPVQSTPDNPYFWSKPTSEPKPDLSGEIKGKAIAGALHEGASALRDGVQGITAAYEKGIQNAVYAAVDPVRDEYMSQLHNADSALRGKETPDPLGRDAPRDVKGLPNTLNTLDSARANGKLSQTDYDARLTSLAKEIRSKYPGFRQYVDEEFKRVTGRDSANQYIRSVIQDIDTFISGKQAKRDSIETHLMTNGLKYHGFDTMYAAYKKDPERNGPMALKWLNENMAADHDTQEFAANSRAQRDQMQVSKEVEDKAFQQYGSSSSKRFWNAAGHVLVTGTDLHNPKWNSDLQAMERGEKVPDMGAEEATAIGSWMTQQGEALSLARTKQLREALNTRSTGGPAQSEMGEEVRSQITDKQIQQQVETERKMYWDHYKDALVKGDVPAALRIHQMNEGRSADSLNTVTTDKQYGATLQRLDTIRKLDPMLYQTITQTFPKIESTLTPLIAKSMIDATTPPAQGGIPYSQILSTVRAKNIQDGNFYKSMVDLIPAIGATGKKALSDEATESLINNVFNDPRGPDFLKAFTAESSRFAPSGGPQGRQYVYDQMYSDAIVKKVAKMAKEKPELFDHLQSSADANARVMMPREYSLAPVQDPTSPDTPPYTPDLYYNDKTHKFSVGPDKDGFIDKGFKREFDQVSTNLNRLAVIEEHNPQGGRDPTLTILEHLVGYQDAEPGSLIYKMMGAIVATSPKKEEKTK